jgi:hypothetical protein
MPPFISNERGMKSLFWKYRFGIVSMATVNSFVRYPLTMSALKNWYAGGFIVIEAIGVIFSKKQIVWLKPPIWDMLKPYEYAKKHSGVWIEKFEDPEQPGLMLEREVVLGEYVAVDVRFRFSGKVDKLYRLRDGRTVELFRTVPKPWSNKNNPLL